MVIKKKWLILSLFLAALFLQGCTDNGCQTPDSYLVDNGLVMLDKEGTIACELCEERGLDTKIIVLESAYCGACRAAVPIIKEVEQELGIEIIYLDLAENADNQRMNEEFKVMPYYTPTMLVGCDVYIGGKTKQEYTKLFKDFSS